MAGGRAGLRVDPKLLEHLSAGRQVALVTGTNGKTTTTRLLTVALGAMGDDVVSNETGSNMPPGHVAALAGTDAPRAVLEVDESYLPRVLTATTAAAVVLLNLSRDQLDRTNEVRMIAAPLAGRPGRRAADPRRGQRRRPAGGLGGRRRPRRALGGRRHALAARCRRLPVVRGPHPLRRRDVGLHANATSPGPGPRSRWGRPRTDRRWPCGPTGGRCPSTSPCPAASTRPTR